VPINIFFLLLTLVFVCFYLAALYYPVIHLTCLVVFDQVFFIVLMTKQQYASYSNAFLLVLMTKQQYASFIELGHNYIGSLYT